MKREHEMKQKSGKFFTFEEEGQYSISVDTEKNRLKLTFLGDLKSPNFLNHTRKALEKLSQGFTLLSHVDSDKDPLLGTALLFKESFRMTQEKELSRAAFVNGKSNFIHKILKNYLADPGLSKLEVKIFRDLDKAEAWLE